MQQLVELADQLAVEAPAVVGHQLQAAVDFQGQLAVFGLIEALGITLQQLRCLAQLTHAGIIPLAALQALPDFQYLTRLIDHALGKVLLEAVAARVFLLDHGPFSVRAAQGYG